MPTTDPERLVQALTASGWEVAGKRKDVYTRLSRPDLPRQSILVPAVLLDAEDDVLLGVAIGELRSLARLGRAAQTALNAIGDDDA